MIPIQSIFLHMYLLLILLYLLYIIPNKHICSILFTLCRRLDYTIITHYTNLFKNTVNLQTLNKTTTQYMSSTTLWITLTQ